MSRRRRWAVGAAVGAAVGLLGVAVYNSGDRYRLYRATRRFSQEWEDEPRKALGLDSVRVREAFEELSAAAAELGGRDRIWQEVRRA